MTLPVIFRRQARREFDEAGDWYEKERAGLGLEFLGEIGRLLSHVAVAPHQFPITHRDVHKAVAQRFPWFWNSPSGGERGFRSESRKDAA